MERFCEQLAEILEVDPALLTPDYAFRSVPDWGSLMGFSILILLQDDYGCRLTVEHFLQLKTVGELYAVVEAKS
jgi:acyl carrier protein